MATPGRKTRSRKGTPEAQLAAELEDAPNLAPDTAASDAGGESPRRSTRRTSPAKQGLPDLANKTSTAYGGQAKPAVSDGVQSNQNFAQALGSIREEAVNERHALIDYDEDREERLPRSGRAGGRAPSVAASDTSTSSTGNRRRVGRPKKRQDLSAIEETEAGPSSAPRSRNMRSSPSKQSRRAPSVDGTTVMDNSADYLPPADIADATVPRRTAPARPVPGSDQHPDRNAQSPLQHRVRQALRNVSQNLPPMPPTRYIWVAALPLIALLFGGLLWSLQSQPKPSGHSNSVAGFHPLETLKQYGDEALTSVTSWTGGWGRGDGTGYPWALDRKVKSLEAELNSIKKGHKLNDDTIKELQRFLPDDIVVHKKNGKYEIPDDFFQALKDRLDRDSSNSDESPSWDSFMAKNAIQLREFARKASDAAVEDALTSKYLVTANEFTTLLDQHFADIGSDLREKVTSDLEAKWHAMNKNASDNALEIAQEAVRTEIRQLPATQMTILTSAKLVHNAELALKHVNFFSAGLGAVVNPYLSSSTQQKKRPFIHKVYAWVTGIRTAYPPLAALERWDEAGDCWCAAPPVDLEALKYDDGSQPRRPHGTRQVVDNEQHDLPNSQHDWPEGQFGPKAQIAVLMPHVIYPQSITVEHIPDTATLDIASAPRKLELWVSIPDAEKRQRVIEHAAYIFADTHPERPRATSRDEGVGLDETYVRISRFTYDIRAINHIQTFALDIKLEEFGVGVNKVVVRATTNWGNEYTCIYRLRMHGELVEYMEEY